MNALLDAAWQNRLEVLAVAFGTVSVWLSVRQKIWSWPTAIVNVLLYVLVFRREKHDVPTWQAAQLRRSPG
jgi:nicotinamide riboside transporter PnuC